MFSGVQPERQNGKAKGDLSDFERGELQVYRGCDDITTMKRCKLHKNIQRAEVEWKNMPC